MINLTGYRPAHLYQWCLWKRVVYANIFQGVYCSLLSSLAPLPTRLGASSGCGWGDGLQIWRLAENIFSEQSKTWQGIFSSLRLGWEQTLLHHTKLACYEILHNASGWKGFFNFNTFKKSSVPCSFQTLWLSLSSSSFSTFGKLTFIILVVGILSAKKDGKDHLWLI